MALVKMLATLNKAGQPGSGGVIASNITDIKIDESYGTAVSTASVVCTDVGDVEVNDVVQIYGGTSALSGLMFTGLIQSIDKKLRPRNVTLGLSDMMQRAVDYAFLPFPTPFGYTPVFAGWPAESIVTDTLQKAFLGFQIPDNGGQSDANPHDPVIQQNHPPFTKAIPYTDFVYQKTYFNFDDFNNILLGLTTPNIIIQFLTAFDEMQKIADLLGYKVWADYTGRIYFKKRPFYPDPSDPGPAVLGAGDNTSSLLSWLQFSRAAGNVLSAEYSRSAENTRNGLMVQGLGNISVLPQRTPPTVPGGNRPILPQSGKTFISLKDGAQHTYPSDFLKGGYFFDEWLISTQTQQAIVANGPDPANPLDKAAEYNLNLLNKATEVATIEVPGDYRIHAMYSNSGNDTGSQPSICRLSSDISTITTYSRNNSGVAIANTKDYIPELSAGLWFLHSMHSDWNKTGFTQKLTLTR
jgi:hypothetical protein